MSADGGVEPGSDPASVASSSGVRPCKVVPGLGARACGFSQRPASPETASLETVGSIRAGAGESCSEALLGSRLVGAP